MKKSTVLSTIIASSIPKLSISVILLGFLSGLSSIQAQEVEILKATVDEEKETLQEEVTLRIKVKDEKERPVSNLRFENFQVYVDGEDEPVKIDPDDWKNPRQVKSPPAWIIFLLDMSGSMKNDDGVNRDISKLQGAINAIREFSRAAASRGNETNVAIVPFAEVEDDEACPNGEYLVNSDTIDNFHLAGSDALEQELQKYEDISNKTDRYGRNPELCGSTNLYRPLINAVEFLDNQNNENFYPPEESGQTQPRLSIILMSDGYHNEDNYKTYFERLKSLLENNKRIVVHSLGYGLKPEQHGLRKSDGSIRPATRDDVENGLVAEEDFVDVNALDEIARLTQGYCDVSMSAREVAKILKDFLDDLLGAYEITYLEPNPERGLRQSVKVVVNSRHFKEDVVSEAEEYRVTVFGRKAPWMMWRLSILAGILGASGLYFLLFKVLGNNLKGE